MEEDLFGSPPTMVGQFWSGVITHAHSLAADQGIVTAFAEPWHHVVLLLHGGLSIPTNATLYGWEVIDVDPVVLTRHPSSVAHPNAFSPFRFSTKVIELCAGSGAMGLGTTFVGARVAAAIEKNTFAAEHLRRNSHGAVFEGSVASVDVLALAHGALDGEPATGFAGFPCQPFSCQGLGKGETDFRFEGFTGTLKATWHLQCQALVLECVPGAQHNAAVRLALDLLCKAMNWSLRERVLDLKSHWPMRRWWCILGPVSWLEKEIPDWGIDPCFQVVGQVFPSWPTWHIHEEELLQVTTEEMHIFGDISYGKDLRLLCATDVAPTLLHSYGSLLSPCPCGCRSSSFSMKTLKAKGARGYYVTSTLTGSPRLLHPVEAATLLGIPVAMKFHYNARDSLALLGQVASPLPTLWIYMHLINSAAKVVPALNPLDPKGTLQAYKHELLRQLHEANFAPIQTNVISLKNQDGDVFHVMAAGTALAGQLLQAERIHLSLHDELVLMRKGRTISLAERFATGQQVDIELQIAQKNGFMPNDNILVAIQTDEQLILEYLNPGQFLFQILPDELRDVYYYADQAGRIFCRDTRIWRSTSLKALGPQAFPTLCKKVGPIKIHTSDEQLSFLPLTSASSIGGGENAQEGLCGSTIEKALQEIIQTQFADCIAPMLIPCPLVRSILLRRHADTLPEHQIKVLRELYDESNGMVLCPFLVDGHWALLFGRLHEGQLHWEYYDGLREGLSDVATRLANILSNSFEVEPGSFQSQMIYKQEDSFRCGSIAVAHGFWACGFHGLFTMQQIAKLHAHLLGRQDPDNGEPRAYGPGALDLHQQLGILLGEKGVFAQHVDDRVQAIIDKLGAGKVTAALKATNPWATLKDLASKPGTNFRLVTREELNAQIASRASNRYGAKIANHKSKKSKTLPTRILPADLDPLQVQIDSDHFRDSDNDKVAQISFDTVTAEARGLAVCSLSQAIPFLRAAKHNSSDALGLLALAELPDDLKTNLPTVALRIPATYGAASHPLLIDGALVQLGDCKIKRHEAASFKEELAKMAVLKIVVYRDELQLQWQDLVASPVKVIIGILPMLQLCKGKQCGSTCARFHAPVGEEYDTAVQEIWGRRFTNAEGKQVASKDAAIFQVFFRALEAAADLASVANIPGIYIEPRINDNLGMDPRFAVVWLPGSDLDSARHTLKTFSEAHALVRVKGRFGIRVKIEDEESAHRQLRPDHSFIKIKVSKVFRITPLPHGVQRATLVKVLASWGWEAKPLQPARGSSAGCAWEIGSATAPPKTILRAFDRDIIISEVRDHSQAPEAPTVVAPAKFQGAWRSHDRVKQLGHEKKVDPWTSADQDPWAKYALNQAGASSQGNANKKHIEEVEARLQAKMKDAVKQQLQDHQGDVTMAEEQTFQAYQEQNEVRFKKLEVGLQEIQQQNQQFHHWCSAAGQRMTTQEQQIATLQTTTENMGNGLQASVQSMGAELLAGLETNFGNRFNQLEALISKKNRTEWLGRPGSKFHAWKPGKITMFLRFILFAFCMNVTTGAAFCGSGERIGEARVPGPSQLWFSTSNPSGLRGKEQHAIDLDVGVHCFSETHLSTMTSKSCSRTLRSLARYKHRDLRVMFPSVQALLGRVLGLVFSLCLICHLGSLKYLGRQKFLNLPESRWLNTLAAWTLWSPMCTATAEAQHGHMLNNWQNSCLLRSLNIWSLVERGQEWWWVTWILVNMNLMPLVYGSSMDGFQLNSLPFSIGTWRSNQPAKAELNATSSFSHLKPHIFVEQYGLMTCLPITPRFRWC